MTVWRDETGTIRLERRCPVDEAEPLLRLLQDNPSAELDWTQCSHLHTAVLQVILAAKPTVTGPCGDPILARFMV